MRLLAALFFALLPCAALAVGPQTPFYVPNEVDCLPPSEGPPAYRPAERPGGTDPASPWMYMPIGNDTPAAVLTWDEQVRSPENGTVHLRDDVRCVPESEAPQVRLSPFGPPLPPAR